MADFEQAFQKTLANEGGFVHSNLPDDSGGETFAGVARNHHPTWPGWAIIDSRGVHDPRLTGLVREFFLANFWNPIHGNDIASQMIAESIYDMAVNSGVGTAARLVQIAVGTVPDGVIGAKTLAAINALDAETIPAEQVFNLQLFTLKVSRFLDIGRKKKSQRQFYQSWIDRALRAVS